MNPNAQRTFTAKEFASMVKRDVRTLYMWSREGKLVAEKDFSGRYCYTTKDYETVTGRPFIEQEHAHILGE